MKVLFWLAKSKRNKQGCVPIYCRVTINGERAEISTNIYIIASEFDKRYKKVKSINIQADTYNKSLNNIAFKLQNIYHNQIYFEEHTPTARELKELYESEFFLKKTSIQALLDEYVSEKNKFNPNSETQRKDARYSQLIKNCLVAINRSNIHVNDFTELVFDELCSYMVDKEDYSTGYAKKTISFLSSVLKYAYKRKYTDRLPLEYKFPYSINTDIVYLSEREVNRIKSYDFEYPALNSVRDCFLIQCYTGLAYIDLKLLNKSNIIIEEDGLWIDKNRQKSKTNCVIPIIDNALDILQKYDFQLPVISNQKYNYHLKRIARFLNINKELTTHVGRKTFGTLLLNKGVPIETVSALLGHSDIKTTQKHYAKVLQMKISKDIRAVL